MKETIQIGIEVSDEAIKDELIAQLSLQGFDAFEEIDNKLLCFISSEKYNTEVLDNVIAKYGLHYNKSVLPDQNWNALWESNFQPVVVDDFCAIRAGFHPPLNNTKHEIIITPKMSFGTGHHATTYMMISEMSKLNFNNKKVADFGTGTGVLAILAEKLGSEFVWAIDEDEWSILNATENIAKNKCKSVSVAKAESFDPGESFDIILANINKNVILCNADNLCSKTTRHGQILLSGLLKDDENEIIFAFTKNGFSHLSTTERNKWICLLLQNQL